MMGNIEYEEFLTELQEFLFKEDAKKNQEEAEKFLQENSAKKVYSSLKMESCNYLNGTVFSSSKEPFPISLDQTLPESKIGVQGDVEGEDDHYYDVTTVDSEDDDLADDD
ncbi:hypothetical protein ACTFIW_000827 [Dictyostelium discoideum]